MDVAVCMAGTIIFAAIIYLVTVQFVRNNLE